MNDNVMLSSELVRHTNNAHKFSENQQSLESNKNEYVLLFYQLIS